MSSPTFFSDGANPNRRDTSYEVLQKILGAITDIPTGNANWTMASLRIGSAGTLTGASANVLALSNGANAQSIDIFNTTTGSEKTTVGYSSNVFVIRTSASGGTPRSINLEAGTGGSVSFSTDGASTRWTINSNGHLVASSARNLYMGAGSTGMTNGFVYIPSAAGAPSGTPTSNSGTIPLYYDSTNNRIYAYNGAWRSVAVA